MLTAGSANGNGLYQKILLMWRGLLRSQWKAKEGQAKIDKKDWSVILWAEVQIEAGKEKR